MLDDIIISRVRVKLLILLLGAPNRIFHVRDIVRRVDEEINAVRRELAHMEKSGMVAKEQRANRLFYSFRHDYPLYYDFMELVAKTSGAGLAIQKNRTRLGKIKYVMLSGRYIRGLPKKSSTDVDLLIVGTVVLPELAGIIKQEEQRVGKELNYTIMTEEEFNFRKSRRDPFVLSIIYGLKVMIIGNEEELIAN